MRTLIFLALSISLWSAPCKGADASGAAAPASPTTNPLTKDATDTTVATLCHIACGELPCCCHGAPHTGQSIAARLNAIDALGTFKTSVSIECLRSLLCKLNEQCDKEHKGHCGCSDFDRTLLALHAIQALGGMGTSAVSAQPEIALAICISPDLSSAIGAANTAINPPPVTTPAATATTPTLDQVVQDLKKGADDLAAYEKSLPPAAHHEQLLEKIHADLEAMKHLIEKIEGPPAAAPDK